MPYQGPTLQAYRDTRVGTHAAALEARDTGRLVSALVETSGSIGNMLSIQHGGPTYDVQRTINYLRAVANSELAALPYQDGLGSATYGAYFGVLEFAAQDALVTRRRWVVTWRHNGGGARPRESHIQADGLTVPAGEPFGVTPGMGSVGCACTAEPSLR